MTSEERHEARYQRRKAKREAQRAKANSLATFDLVFSFGRLYRSAKLCYRGVGWKGSTQSYRTNELLNVGTTYRQLKARKRRLRRCYEFDIFERGKPRHIMAVYINDRVPLRCLCDYALIPLLTRSFIFDNGACMSGKGISFTLDRLERHLHQFWNEYGVDGYVLIFDIHGFFPSIRHDLVMSILEAAIYDEEILRFTEYSISQFGEGVGLGLGSPVSQVCALASLNKLDHLIKEKARIRYYGRYMDDGYLIHHSKEYLQRCRKAIIRYCNSIGLELNENKTQIRPLRRGVRFLKVRFILKESGRVIRLPNRRNVTSMRRKLKKFRRWVDDPQSKFEFEDARTSITSWFGHISQCNSWRTQQRMELLFRDLFAKELMKKMYSIMANGQEVGVAEALNYVLQQPNGYYVLCNENAAQGICFDGTVYQLADRPAMLPALTEVRVIRIDAGTRITSQEQVASIVFVAAAESGGIDDVTAGEHADIFAEWAERVSYEPGNIRRYNGLLYRCIEAHTSQSDWTPDVAVSLWVRVADPGEEWPAWSRPVGAHDAYQRGDKVSHNEYHWVSDYDANVWEPGVYGWHEAQEGE